MKVKHTRWGILGLGKIARKFCLGLQHVEGAEIYAVASRSQEKADFFAKEHHAKKAYGSYEEMIKDENVDVIYVATPHVFHFKQTLLCLRNKKPVLCEKPFAMNKAEVEQMIATAKKEKVFLMEAMWTQFLPHFEYVYKLVQSGVYGKIKSLKADFGFAAEFDENGRLFNKDLGGGSLLDIGIYPVFMALSFLGEPEKITASANFSTTEIDEECNMIFHYPGGVEAKLDSNIGRKTPTTATIVLEKATISMNSRFHEPTSVQVLTPEGEESSDFNVVANGYNFEAEHVQKMLKEGRTESTEMTFEKSLQLIGLLDRIRTEIGLEY